MKNLKYICLILFSALAFSCADDSLDPLNLKQVKKGTILALRGAQLDNIYWNGLPGAEFFPKAISGSEKFEFDAEYLSEDPQSLESIDVFAVKRVKTGSTITRDRVLLKNVPFSEFKETAEYPNPWVSVSLTLTEVLDKIGLAVPLDATEVATLLDLYKFGINIETDLNLKDGSKVLAADIVAAGLFQSDQFYPAQILTYTVTDFCTYDDDLWSGTYTSTEFYEDGAYGPYDVTLSQDGGNPNKFTLDNFWDYGLSAYVIFNPSTTGFAEATVEFPEQTVDGETLTGTGTYDQCKGIFKIQTEYAGYTWRYEFVKQ
jgi:hypothetical protein